MKKSIKIKMGVIKNNNNKKNNSAFLDNLKKRK